MTIGKIIKTYNGFYYVSFNNQIVTCKLRGRLKKEKPNVFTGDNVVFSLLPDNTGIIENILPRKNLLRRPNIANIDQVILVFSVAEPAPHPLLIDRFLVMAEWSNIPNIILCFNKLDLAKNSETENLLSLYKKIGYTVLEVSAHSSIGKEELISTLSFKTTVFAGPSGVGKSSLLNNINPTFNFRTGNLSEKIKRGKHTTRVTSLVPHQNGSLVDTPGFSVIDLLSIPSNELGQLFPEFRTSIGFCKFRLCTHSHEPDCAIKNLLQMKKISKSRYQSYIKILNEIQEGK